jgi:hypothetical protein
MLSVRCLDNNYHKREQVSQEWNTDIAVTSDSKTNALEQ